MGPVEHECHLWAQQLLSSAIDRSGSIDPEIRQDGRERAIAVDHRLTTLRIACHSLTDFLDGLFGARLDGYVELDTQLTAKCAYLLELAETLRLFALNALLASTRLGADGIVLRAVADIMRSSSDSIRMLIRGLSDHLDDAGGLLGEVGFRVSAAKLQSLMAIVLADELLEGDRSRSSWGPERGLRLRDLARLSESLDDSFRLLRDALERLELHLSGVARTVERLSDEIKVMRALEVNGRIEAARAAKVDAIVFLFAEIHAQTNTARDELAEFANVTRRGRVAASRRSSARVPASLSKIHDCATRLAA